MVNSYFSYIKIANTDNVYTVQDSYSYLTMTNILSRLDTIETTLTELSSRLNTLEEKVGYNDETSGQDASSNK